MSKSFQRFIYSFIPTTPEQRFKFWLQFGHVLVHVALCTAFSKSHTFLFYTAAYFIKMFTNKSHIQPKTI